MAYTCSSIKTNVFNLCSQLLYMEISTRAFINGTMAPYNTTINKCLLRQVLHQPMKTTQIAKY